MTFVDYLPLVALMCVLGIAAIHYSDKVIAFLKGSLAVAKFLGVVVISVAIAYWLGVETIVGAYLVYFVIVAIRGNR